MSRCRLRCFLLAAGLAHAVPASPAISGVTEAPRAISPASPAPDTVRADTLSPGEVVALRASLVPLFEEGAFEELFTVSGRLVDSSGRDPLPWMARAVSADRTGRTEVAESAYRRAFELGTQLQPWLARNAAALHARLGHRREALAWLERALDAGLEDRVELQEAEAFGAYREDPEFRRMMGLPPDSSRTREARWRYDLDFLVQEARRLHPGPERPALGPEFDAAARRLRRRIPELDDEEILVEMQRLVALLGDGHSVVYGVEWGQEPGSGIALPVIFYLFDDGLHIVDATPEHRDLVGSRVVRIGDRSPEEVLAALRAFVNRDNEMTMKWLGVRFYLRGPRYLRAVGAASADGGVRLTVRTRGNPAGATATAGRDSLRTVTLVPTSDDFPRKLRPPRGMEPSRVPMWLSRVDTSYWTKHLADHGALYFQFNQVRDAEGESLAGFARRLRRELADTEARSLVVDVRHNNGGNNGLLRPLVRTLIHWEVSDPDHTIYVLTGRNTFSAAQNFVNRLERWTDAVFAGEPSSSRPNFVGESTNVVLPYSRQWVSLSSRYWQDSDPGDHRPWIAPDLPVEYTADDHFAGRDPVLEVVLRAATAKSSPSQRPESSQ